MNILWAVIGSLMLIFVIISASCDMSKNALDRVATGPIWNRANASNYAVFGTTQHRTLEGDVMHPGDDPPALLRGQPNDCPVWLSQGFAEINDSFTNPCALCHCDDIDRFTDHYCYDINGNIVLWENRGEVIRYRNPDGTTTF